MVDFFISLSGKDKAWGDWIAWQLKQAGYTLLYQHWDFQTGRNFLLHMEEGGKEADRVLVVLSDSYFASDYTIAELTQALSRDVAGREGTIVPVKVADCDLKGSLLGPRSYIDLTSSADEATARETLLRGLKPKGPPTTAPPFPGEAKPPAKPPFPGKGPAAPTPSRIQNPVSFFTGREAVLKELREALQSHGRAALSGLPGVGKTQTALEYARKHRRRYSRQLWARAETPEGLLSDFAALARDLDLPEKDEQDLDAVAAAVKKWLEAATGWLLVLDNADDLPGIRPWLPKGDGHVLLTTRASATGGIAEMVEIREMYPEEGAVFLLRRAKLIAKKAELATASASDVETAKEIVKELGGLPLAIDQAGAFIEETRRGLSEYLELYRTEGTRLRARRGKLAADHESVAVTLSLAFGKVEQESKAAADLIRLCAFLAPDDIPEELFTEGAAELTDDLAAAASKPIDFAETVEAAGRFSLIRRNPSRRSIDQHRLVQDVVKDEMDEAEKRTWAERAVRVVNAVFPSPDYRNWALCERLLPHARIAAELIRRHEFEFVEAARGLNQIATYLCYRARYPEAEPLFRRALAIREKVLGPDHPDVVASLNKLGELLHDQGRHGEAEPLYWRALGIAEKALRPDHPDLADSLNNFGSLLSDFGRHGEAETLQRLALAIREKALGPDHPDVAVSLNNLAGLLRITGRRREAEPLHRRALAIREKALGSDHPDVATSLNNLAVLLYAQDRLAEVEPLCRRTLAILEKALPPDHPHMATPLGNLAALLERTGRGEEARKLRDRAASIRAKGATE